MAEYLAPYENPSGGCVNMDTCLKKIHPSLEYTEEY